MLTAETLAFLAELGANNERAWFEANKPRYRAHVEAPLRELVGRLAPAMLAIDPALGVDPRRGTISRIHRDTRFARDKSPYRVNQWIAFKRGGEDWPDRPAFFFEFGPRGWRCGMGTYCATPATMSAVRAAMAVRPVPFRAAFDQALAAGCVVEGEEYKRPRVVAGLDGALADWAGRRNAYLARNAEVEDELLGGALGDRLEAVFAALAPLYRLLLETR